ncbi:MAG: luxQ [Adhaeribacter sp.]|nr:luxQ [Adhaeribacter sp.]
MNKLKILLAEGDVHNQHFVRKVTVDYDFTLDIAENGQVAISKLNDNEYDLVMLNLDMPVMNGFETTTYIRERMGHKSNIPIIVVACSEGVSDATKCLLLGANSYLTRPFNSRDLLSEINTLFV